MIMNLIILITSVKPKLSQLISFIGIIFELFLGFYNRLDLNYITINEKELNLLYIFRFLHKKIKFKCLDNCRIFTGNCIYCIKP